MNCHGSNDSDGDVVAIDHAYGDGTVFDVSFHV